MENISPNPGWYAKLKGKVGKKANRDAERDSSIGFLKVTNCLLIVGILICGQIISSLLPLKTVAMYRMEVDSKGTVTPVKMVAEKYMPSENEIRARLKELVVRQFTIRSKESLKTDLKIVENQMTGQARVQFSEFLRDDRPYFQITEKPDLTREVKVIIVNKPPGSDIYFVDFETRTRVGINAPVVSRKNVLFNIFIKPARTDEEVLGENPGGIYVSSFQISDVKS
ncbi:VirB8/TrbF family protein [Flavobacterium sp.]|uniref:VirB8/TrbF family protein n=1 Tax=Flavobacterium sp. TaxID=239 RepID=UPI002609597B|nr:VirB8/TrbF family protein [Flavobacterium sp.]